MRLHRSLLLFPLTLLALPVAIRAESVPLLLGEMIRKARSVRTLEYTIQKWERIDGSLYYEENTVRLQRNPFRVYLRQMRPRAGMEVLFRSGANNERLLIHPAGAPFIDLNLSPDNGQVRKNQHHNIYAMGFDYFIDIIDYILKDSGGALHFDPPRPATWNGRQGVRIVLFNPHFAFQGYRVKQGEDLFAIARKLKVGEYMILKHNPSLGWYGDARPGEAIQVPNSYAKRTELFLDGQTGLPLSIQIFDDRGLYEKYEYYNFILNPPLKEGEFMPDFPEYHF